MPDTGKVRMNMREGVRKEGGYRDAPASKNSGHYYIKRFRIEACYTYIIIGLIPSSLNVYVVCNVTKDMAAM